MARFMTIGYGEREGYDRLSEDARTAAHAHDANLRAAGAIMGIARSPIQVRNHNGTGTVTQNGAFMRSSLPIAGFALIEAANVDEAIAMVSKAPCAVAYGVVEVWALE